MTMTMTAHTVEFLVGGVSQGTLANVASEGESIPLFTVTFRANPPHNLTRSPVTCNLILL